MAQNSIEESSEPAVRGDARTYVDSPLITLQVGKERKTYHIHRNLLVTYSKYFRACLTSRFVEGQNSMVDLLELDEDEDAAFKLMLFWLYGGDLKAIIGYEGFDVCFSGTTYALDLYRIADRFLMPQFKNGIMDALLNFNCDSDFYANSEMLIKVFRAGLLNSGFGKYYAGTLARELYNCDIAFTASQRFGPTNECWVRKILRAEVTALFDTPEVLAAVIQRLFSYEEDYCLTPREGDHHMFYDDDAEY